MSVTVEIRAGASAGRRVALAAGRSHTFGRVFGRAEFAVPDDKQMSGIHFGVECGADGCRVVDKGSTNGTFLNGARIREAMLLANGDEIKAGATTFVVRIVPEHQLVEPTSRTPTTGAAVSSSARVHERPDQVPLASRPTQAPASPQEPVPGTGGSAGLTPKHAAANAAAVVSAPPKVVAGDEGTARSAALAIGSWAFHEIPERWQIQEGLGIQQVVKDEFASSILVTEEVLAAGTTLAQYVDAQSKMLRENLPAPKIDAVAAPTIPGSTETLALEVRFTIKDGPAVFFHRVYVRSGAAVGVLNFTSLEKDVAALRPVYDAALSAISFTHQD